MSWYANRVEQGLCPRCAHGAIAPGKTRCERCLATANKVMRKYRRTHHAKQNAYMRKYMQTYRLAKRKAKALSAPQEARQATPPLPEGYAEAPSRAWLLARLAALTDAAT